MNRLSALVRGVIWMISMSSGTCAFAQSVFISEIHYDNTGGDVNEGVEIFAPAGTDLSCYSLVFYNGASPFASYLTQALTGTVDDEGCGYGAISFSVAGIQNGAPDGLALYNTCTSTLVQFLSYEGTFTASGGVANGVLSTSIGVSETGSEPVGQSLQLTGTGTTYGDFSWNAPSAASAGSINAGMDPCAGCTGPVAEPTTETSADVATSGCTSATIDWTNGNGDNVVVVISTGAIGSTPADGTAYTASAVYASGEIIGAGQYVVYNGSGTSVTVTGLTIGTTYNYAIFGYDGAQADCEENYLTGGNFGSFTTLASCGTAQITTLMVNSCSGSSEGTDELIVIQNGDEAINIDDMIIDLPNTSWCNSGCGGNTIGNSATYLADLNTMAGCTPDLFVYADPIPAGATIIIFTGNPPTTVLDYSSNCGAPGAPIYAIFLDNSSITGNFANSGSTIKVIDIDFGNGQSDAVSYIPDDVANVDGGSILYDDAGNPSYYTSTDCVYPLSVRLNSFFATKHELTVELNWSSFSQAGDTHYLIQRSIDGISFETIGETEIGFAADDFTDYAFTDQNLPVAEVIYYRLAIVSENNKLSYSGIISVLNTGTGVYYANQNFVVSSDHQTETIQPYFIYSIAGNLVAKGVLDDSGLISFTHKGVFILEIPGLKIRQKIVCL